MEINNFREEDPYNKAHFYRLLLSRHGVFSTFVVLEKTKNNMNKLQFRNWIMASMRVWFAKHLIGHFSRHENTIRIFCRPEKKIKNRKWRVPDYWNWTRAVVRLQLSSERYGWWAAETVNNFHHYSGLPISLTGEKNPDHVISLSLQLIFDQHPPPPVRVYPH